MMMTTFGCGQWGWFATSSPIDIHEGTHRWILGQVMVFNCFTWFFSLFFIEQAHLAQSFPPIDTPYISTCCNAR